MKYNYKPGLVYTNIAEERVKMEEAEWQKRKDD